MGIQRKITKACPWGERPDTHQFPVTLDVQQEEKILQFSSICRMVWNFFVQESNYRIDLAKRVNSEEVFEEEKVYDQKKDEWKFDTNISAISFNYLLTSFRNSPFFAILKKVKLTTLRETARAVAGGFDSWMRLRKNGDQKARSPFYKNDEVFQTLIFKDLVLKNGSLDLNGVHIDLPRSTVFKLKDRKLAHVVLDRSEKKLYLPGSYKIQAVAFKPAVMPIACKRLVGVDVGSRLITLFDSRGKAFYIYTRRPDYYHRPRLDEVEKKLSAMKVPIDEARKNKVPKQEIQAMWRALELDPQYQKLKAQKQKINQKMRNQWKDYRKKLVARLVEYGDAFFVGQSIVRTKEGKQADAQTGDTTKNWEYQNTGYASEIIQLLEWACVKAGKICLKVPDSTFEEEDIVERKLLQARKHLLVGMRSNAFQAALQKQLETFENGYRLLDDAQWEGYTPEQIAEINRRKAEFEFAWNEQEIAKKARLIEAFLGTRAPKDLNKREKAELTALKAKLWNSKRGRFNNKHLNAIEKIVHNKSFEPKRLKIRPS